ncbi:DUF7662 domain-containing protein [Curtobacterium luteum]|uniref:DUF7662 domain-containing protein n=1 Tax=Curtobacterium luteum TaxID=33881 RepID=UPI000A907030|nr:hypothetical protein [Curtobacterium luteum]
MTSTEIRMGPWRPLYEYLAHRPDKANINITYDDIEAIVQLPLPSTARSRPEWWTVIPLKQRARSWLAAGRHPSASDAGVVFRRTERLAARSLSDQRRLRFQMESHAVSSLRFGPSRDEVDQGWWEPHDVYLIHFPEARVTKVGITNSRTGRAQELSTPGGTVVQANRLANRFGAVVLEGAFLQLADDLRTEPPLWLAQTTGVTEFWSDSFPTPSIDMALAVVGSVAELSNWKASVLRPADVVAVEASEATNVSWSTERPRSG